MKLPKFRGGATSNNPTPDPSAQPPPKQPPLPPQASVDGAEAPEQPPPDIQQQVSQQQFQPLDSNVTPIPFNGVPPPPPSQPPQQYTQPNADPNISTPAPAPATAPDTKPVESGRKKILQRFKKPSRKQAAADASNAPAPAPPPPPHEQQSQQPPVITPSDNAPDSIAQPPIPAPDASPPPPQQPPPPVDPRAAERAEEERRHKLMEGVTGLSLGPSPSEKAAMNPPNDDASSDSDAESRDDDDHGGGASEGKPEEDAVVGSIEEPPVPPPLPHPATQSHLHPHLPPHQTRSHLHHPLHPHQQMQAQQMTAPHFIDTSHIDNPSLHQPQPPPSVQQQPTLPGDLQDPATVTSSTQPTQPSETPAQMAELFASRAFGADTAHASPFPRQPPPLVPPPPPSAQLSSAPYVGAPDFHAPPHESAAMGGHHSTQHHQPPSPSKPAAIGWGSVVDTMPSRPLYGPPTHLAASTARGPMDLDPQLADKLQRGRELALLAVQQEEKGNMGAAEAGYIKALSLLVPAASELDVGSELTLHMRMQHKKKVQREAAAMLDRCEELRKFLKANGPAVPKELPNVPGTKPSPPSRDLKPSDKGELKKNAGPKFPAPPRPPMDSTGNDQLLSRIANRNNVLPNVQGRTNDAPAPPPFPTSNVTSPPSKVDDLTPSAPPPPEEDSLSSPPPPPRGGSLSTPPPPSREDSLLTPPPPPREDSLSTPPPPPEEDYLSKPPPPPEEDYLSKPPPPPVDDAVLTPPPTDNNRSILPPPASISPPSHATPPPPPPAPLYPQSSFDEQSLPPAPQLPDSPLPSGQLPPSPPPHVYSTPSQMGTVDSDQSAFNTGHETLTVGSNSAGTSSDSIVQDRCFLCNRMAHLRTKCNHTFCSSCGNQAVSVFRMCPVKNCGRPLAIEDFEHILR